MNCRTTYVLLIACAAILVGACNPLDVDTPRDVRIDNPDPVLRPSRTLSVMFALDASNSMAFDSDLKRAASAIESGLDYLEGKYDLAGLVWFNSNVSILPLTSKIYDINRKLNEINTTSETFMWDGVYRATEELVNGEERDVRAVILITDGMDDGSEVELDSIITYATENNVYIYTVGLRGAVVQDPLKYLAIKTDGSYYHNSDNADSLRVIISDIIVDKLRQTL